MAVYKNNPYKFTQIPDKIMLDTNISHGAFRVYCYLFSKPDGWDYFSNDIKKKLNIKKDHTIANYLKELRENNWVERKRNIKTNGYDYILNTNNEVSLSKRYEELEKQAKTNPQALFLVCQSLLDGFEFSIPYNRLDLKQCPTVHLHLRMDINGYFYDLAEEVYFNEERSKLVWAYLWQDRLNEVMIYIKQKRR